MAQSWEERILAEALKEVRNTWGQGWALLGTEIRQALLARAVLASIAQQDVDSYNLEQKERSLGKILHLADMTIQAEV